MEGLGDYCQLKKDVIFANMEAIKQPMATQGGNEEHISELEKKLRQVFDEKDAPLDEAESTVITCERLEFDLSQLSQAVILAETAQAALPVQSQALDPPQVTTSKFSGNEIQRTLEKKSTKKSEVDAQKYLEDEAMKTHHEKSIEEGQALVIDKD